jgi:hypothetical protein
VGTGWFSNPCASDNWLRTGLEKMEADFEDVREKAVEAFLLAGVAIAFPLTPPPIKAAAIITQGNATATIVLMQALLGAIMYLKELLGPGPLTFGDTLAAVANACADLGLFSILRGVYGCAAEGEHEYDKDHPRTPAISYGAMDEHDYLNVGCVAPGDSIEIFVDADSPELPKFIDHALARVRDLENGNLSGGSAQAFGGYLSLRFMTTSDAFLATQLWPRTCSIEIAGLSRVHGTEPFLRTLEEDAKSFDVVLHWGQRNGWSMKEIEKWYSPLAPSGRLFLWRKTLSDLSEHGRWAAFSTAFSAYKGLEVTDPIIGKFSAKPSEGCADDKTRVSWDAVANPPETNAFLVHAHENDGSSIRIPLPGLTGEADVTFGNGKSQLTLVLERELNGHVYSDSASLALRGIAQNEPWKFVMVATPRLVDGVPRWAAEINLYSQFISNALHATHVLVTSGAAAAWRVRHPDIGDVSFTTGAVKPLPGAPVFNKNWLFFTESAASGPAPPLDITFTITCQH